MVTTRMAVNPDVINHYILASHVNPETINMRGLGDILSGVKQPTFNQISSIAKKIHVPTGLLMLPEIVNTDRTRLQFRTVGSHQVRNMSAELRDTIAEMQVKQDFLRDENEESLDFLGKFSHERNVSFIAQNIRQYLELPCPLDGSDPQKVLNTVRSAVGRIGVYIFFNGKIKDNTHRKLSVDEFRGFVLFDLKAPIIFINGCDSKRGQLFTLIHETVHLFIGSEDIMENIDYVTPEEAFVNAITSEILLPLSQAARYGLPDVHDLAERYKVSEEVAVRRLYDAGRVTHDEYDQYIAYLDRQYMHQKEYKQGSSGGNYCKTLHYRIDPRFFQTVQNALTANRITPTDAFSIVGVGYKGYKSLAGDTRQ